MTGFGSCGACKFLRRKCTSECVFAPYFCYDQASTHFAAVHKVFGASNVSRLLMHLPLHNRSDAAITLSYEALARMQDPIYGCVAHIFALQQQVIRLQEEIDTLGNLMAINSPVAAVASGNSQAPTSSQDGLQLFMQQDAVNIQFCENEQAPHLPPGGATTVNHNLHEQVPMEYPIAHGPENHFMGEFNPNPFERLLAGIDHEIYVNNQWFNFAPTS